MTTSPAQQQEELLLVAGLFGIIVAMVASLLWWQRRKEAQLAALETVALPIDSVLRSIVVFVPAACVVPVCVGLVGHFTDPWMRGHALGAVLISVLGGLLSLPVAGWATARFRSIGSLQLSPSALQLSLEGQPSVAINLSQPFALNERWTLGPDEGRFQVVEVTDGHVRVGFMYPVGLRGKPTGEEGPGGWPAFGREGRLLHDRLRGRHQALAGAR
jgi:hypothetical protein